MEKSKSSPLLYSARTVGGVEPLSYPELSLPFRVRSVGYYYTLENWEEAHPEGKSNFIQIFWCVDGCGCFRFSDRLEYLHANEVIYHLPGEAHIHRAVSKIWRYYWITLEGDWAVDFFAAYNYPQKPIPSGPCPEMLFRELEKLLTDLSIESRKKQIAVAVDIIGMIGRQIVPENSSSVLGQARLLIANNFSRAEFNVNLIASVLKIDRTTLARIFKKELGISPLQYIIQTRMNHAQKLLCSTNMPIKDVALSSGFANFSYFGLVFRRKHSMTPAAYRIANAHC